MNRKVRSILITVLVIMLILVLLMFNHIWFRTGPTAIYSKLDEKALIGFEQEHKLENLELVSRHAMDDVIYSAKDNNYYYLFLDDLKLLDKVKVTDVDIDRMENYGKEILGEKTSVMLTYFDQQPAWALENSNKIVIVDFSLKQLLEFDKGLDKRD